jgi:hypothetical protein
MYMDILKVEVLDLLVPGRSLQEPTERYDREVKKTAGKNNAYVLVYNSCQ